MKSEDSPPPLTKHLLFPSSSPSPPPSSSTSLSKSSSPLPSSPLPSSSSCPSIPASTLSLSSYPLGTSPPSPSPITSTPSRSHSPLSHVTTLRSGGLKEKLNNLIFQTKHFLSPSRPMFYSHVFDPPLIIYQIVVIQVCFWFLFSLFSSVLALSLSYPVSMAYLFNPGALSSHNGYIISYVSFFFTTLITSYFLALIVERSRKCLDFAATLHVYHLLVILIHTYQVPPVSWWLAWSLSLIIMAGLSMLVCGEWETRSIKMSSACLCV